MTLFAVGPQHPTPGGRGSISRRICVRPARPDKIAVFAIGPGRTDIGGRGVPRGRTAGSPASRSTTVITGNVLGAAGADPRPPGEGEAVKGLVSVCGGSPGKADRQPQSPEPHSAPPGGGEAVKGLVPMRGGHRGKRTYNGNHRKRTRRRRRRSGAEPRRGGNGGGTPPCAGGSPGGRPPGGNTVGAANRPVRGED